MRAFELGPKEDLFKVEEIEVRGLKKVEPEAILEKIKTKKGEVLTNYRLREDIDLIYSMKYFETVEAHQETKDGKLHLVFLIKERPIIKEIRFEGNSELDNDDLSGKIKSKAFSILDINQVKSDVTALQKFYEEKGYYLAAVEHQLDNVTDENIELVFNIKEFDKVRVKKIDFLGNRSFSDKELKGIMETREESLFSFMTGSGNFKELNFQTDIERLKYFYKTKGHLQINVGKPEVTVSIDKKWIFISIKVNEGPQFYVNEIKYDGELLFPIEKLAEKATLKSGGVYSEDQLRIDIQNLTEMYQDEGYAFANVLRTLDVVPGENKVDVTFSFEKGRMAYFGKINVKGNTKTRDKVLRRELKIQEGMKFSGSALRISKENVSRLGFFEQGSVIFNTVPSPGNPDILDVDILVKETNTGQIQLGAGFSTNTGAFLQASISQRNFRGLGQDLSFTSNISKKNKEFRLGFIEPYFLDSKWTAGGDIFDIRNKGSLSFDSQRTGFNLRVGHPLWGDYTRYYVVYKFEETRLTNVKDETIITSLENGIVSSIENSIIHDKRDNRWQPTKGHYGSLSLEVAGVGGDQKWVKTEAEGRYFYPIVGDLIFRSRFWGGRLFEADTDYLKGTKEIPRSQKYVLGGPRNLRGYNYEDIGPHVEREIEDKNNPNKKFFRKFNQGGMFAVFSQLELEHPLVAEAGLKWVVFFDIGNVYKESFTRREGEELFRADYGYGLRWFSPIGVLRFEFGHPINRRSGEDDRQFNFDIGQLF